MNDRKLTSQELNRLFCSPKFIRRVEEAGKKSADVYIEASDEEVTEWLAEGARMERRLRSDVTCSSMLSDHGNSGVSESALRTIKLGILGLLVALVALGLCVLLTSFGEAMSPGTQWHFHGETYEWPSVIFLFAAIMGVPGFFGGAIVSRFAQSPKSVFQGFIGVAFGVFLHVQTMILGLSGGIIVTIVVILLPTLSAIALCLITNLVFRSNK